MKSPLPKVLHTIAGRPMVEYVVRTARCLSLHTPIIVIGYKAALVKKALGAEVRFALQRFQRGTGHAVMQTEKMLKFQKGHVIVLAGDVPFITSGTLKKLYRTHIRTNAHATVLSVRLKDPGHYGRIVRSASGAVEKIVEFKDALPSERRIREINSGIYVFRIHDIFDALKNVKPENEQKEYYLTDVIEILISKKKKVMAIVTEDHREAMGINTIEELKHAETVMSNT